MRSAACLRDGAFRAADTTFRMRCRIASPPLAGTALALGLSQLSVVDESRAPGDHDHDGQLRCLILVHTSGGRCQTSVHGRDIVHRMGTFAAYAPGSQLRNRVPAGTPWTCRYLMLTGPWAERIAAQLEDGLLVEPRPPASMLARFDVAIASVLDAGADWDWQLARALAELALWIGSQGLADGDLLLAVGRLVDANPEEPWPLATVANRLGLGVDALDHRFRQRSGCAPARWIRTRRIAHAQRLMAAGATDRAAAEAIGMDAPAFSRAFLAVTGQRPSGWRRNLTAW